MAIIRRSVSDLIPYENNPRTHPQEQIEQLTKLIQEFGFHDSHAIAVDEEGVILWGHGRLQAAIAAGMEEVPVEVIDGLNDAKKRALRIADNGIAEQSDWDMECLLEELSCIDGKVDSSFLGLSNDLMEDMGALLSATDSEHIIQGEDSQEINTDEYTFEHKCPRCGFEFDD